MIIEPHAAAHFIAGYQRLLTEVDRQRGGPPNTPVLEMLVAAREAAASNPVLMDAAASSLAAGGRAVAADVLAAVRTLRTMRWVFLRDTTKYSVFVDVHGTEAYAVVGLTERIRDIFGGSGVAIHTGLFEYRGRYVCDGLASAPAWLGANLKREFNAKLSALKSSGAFHVACEP